MNSNFKFVKGFDNRYKIFEDGRIYSFQGKRSKRGWIELKWKRDRYARVTLYGKGLKKCFSVHRLVAEYFIPNPENKPMVNHIDGNTFNNKICNLEWCTASENLVHSIKVLKANRNTELQRKSASICGKKHRKLNLLQADEIRDKSISIKRSDLSKLYNVSLSVIDKIINKKTYIK